MLAERGATVAIVGRNRRRGEQLETDHSSPSNGEIRFHRADLASQDAVRALATEIQSDYDRLDVIVHNAGLTARRRTETVDGIERTLAVNHLAPYLLTYQLLDVLWASSPSRVVVTASRIHRRGTLDFDDLQFERGCDGLQAYARSKLANVAFTLELADRLDDDVTANCFHPGFVPSTNLFRDAAPWTRLTMRLVALLAGIGTSQRTGARRLVRLATDSLFGERTGLYVGGDGSERPAAAARDPDVRERLWAESAALVGVDPQWPSLGCGD